MKYHDSVDKACFEVFERVAAGDFDVAALPGRDCRAGQHRQGIRGVVSGDVVAVEHRQDQAAGKTLANVVPG
jgi:hypothetical protein